MGNGCIVPCSMLQHFILYGFGALYRAGSAFHLAIDDTVVVYTAIVHAIVYGKL